VSEFAEDLQLTTEQAREIIAPFYKALNAGNDAITLVNQATSRDWMSCGGNDTCRQRDQVGAAIAGLQRQLDWRDRPSDRAIVFTSKLRHPAPTDATQATAGASRAQ